MISGRNYLIILMYIKEKHTNIKYKSIQMHVNICIHTHIYIHMKTYKYIKIYETQEHTNILFFSSWKFQEVIACKSICFL